MEGTTNPINTSEDIANEVMVPLLKSTVLEIHNPSDTSGDTASVEKLDYSTNFLIFQPGCRFYTWKLDPNGDFFAKQQIKFDN